MENEKKAGRYRDDMGLDMENMEPLRPVPQQRIMDKVNECMSRRDYAGVERVLRYWLEEARAGRDFRGQLMVLNEMVGHYRKTREQEKAQDCAVEALSLLHILDLEDSISDGTTCVNIATAYNSFGKNEEALRLFQQARGIYERAKDVSPSLLGGLYNNMGLTCAALGRFDEALALYDLAFSEMGKAPNGALEQAVTCLNRANALEGRDGMERGESQIFALLDQAQALLERKELPRDGYYAFVLEKCAPTFEYYGYFLAAEQMKKQAEALYAGA